MKVKLIFSILVVAVLFVGKVNAQIIPYEAETDGYLYSEFEVEASAEFEIQIEKEYCKEKEKSSGKYLSILTYNIWKNNRKLTVHADVIKCSGADVVAVQEILGARNFRRLKNLTGLDGQMCVTLNIPFFQYGIAMLWRPELGPPMEIENVKIRSSRNDADRRRAYIIAEFADFCFVATHFSLYQGDRIRMTDSIINHPITRRCISVGKPVFVAGDINAQPFQPTIARFEEAGFEVLNNTARTDEYQTRPSRQLHEKRYKDATRASGAMIDLILGHPSGQEILVRDIPCFPKDWLMVVSDHFPYRVVVRLK